jgi:hypothetical protein
MANIAEYKSAFMWSLLASIQSHSRCKDGVTNVPARRECTAAEDVSVALMVLTLRPTGLTSPAQTDREEWTI